MKTAEPTAKLQQLQQELRDLKLRVELTHIRFLDGGCAQYQPCLSCLTLEQIDRSLEWVAKDIARAEACLK